LTVVHKTELHCFAKVDVVDVCSKHPPEVRM